MRVDVRAGSNEFIEPLKAAGVPVEPATLAAGDMEILGQGPEGVTMVGIEHKKLPDLFTCLRDGRLAEQVRKMHPAYHVRWLLIEGRIQGVANGQPMHLQSRRGRWKCNPLHLSYQEMVGRVLTFCHAAGMLVWRTESQDESVSWLRGLNLWWTAKEWEQHRDHLETFSPEAIGGNPLERPKLRQRVAKDLPRLGVAKAVRAAEHFATTRDMINAPVEEWQLIEGVGKKIAETIVREVSNE